MIVRLLKELIILIYKNMTILHLKKMVIVSVDSNEPALSNLMRWRGGECMRVIFDFWKGMGDENWFSQLMDGGVC